MWQDTPSKNERSGSVAKGNDPTSQEHFTVTKTKNQANRKANLKDNESMADPENASFELMTPKNILSGMGGINRASNKSDSRSVGSGSAQGLKLGAGVPAGINKPSNKSNSKSVGA